MSFALDNYSPNLPKLQGGHNIGVEMFIAVKDNADGTAVKLIYEENNNLDKVKVLKDDKENEEDESLPEVENPRSSEISFED